MPDQASHDERSSTGKKTGAPNLAHHLELCSWLDTATNGLCEAAKQRVDAEIRSHYAEAVATERPSGHNDDDAHRVAMQALGNPTKARRAFRRAYLTKGEGEFLWRVQMLESERTKASTRFERGVALAFLFTLGLAVCEIFSLGLTEHTHWWLIFFPGLCVNCTIKCWLCPRLAAQRLWRRYVAWGYVNVLVVLLIFCVEPWFEFGPEIRDSGSPAWSLSLLVLLCLGSLLAIVLLTILICRGIPMLRKLGKHAEMYDSLMEGDADDEGGHYA